MKWNPCTNVKQETRAKKKGKANDVFAFMFQTLMAFT